MAYYCGECIVWRGSSDENKYGERWCSFSRRYERSDQNTYGCKGFLYVGRAVLTKVCEILQLDPTEWFAAFDTVKDTYLISSRMDMLVSYCSIGPILAEKLQLDNEKTAVATNLMKNFLLPAKNLSKNGYFLQAANTYRDMISFLKAKYQVN